MISITVESHITQHIHPGFNYPRSNTVSNAKHTPTCKYVRARRRWRGGGGNKQLSTFARVYPQTRLPLISFIATPKLPVSTTPEEEMHFDVDVLRIFAETQAENKKTAREWR